MKSNLAPKTPNRCPMVSWLAEHMHLSPITEWGVASFWWSGHIFEFCVFGKVASGRLSCHCVEKARRLSGMRFAGFCYEFVAEFPDSYVEEIYFKIKGIIE